MAFLRFSFKTKQANPPILCLLDQAQDILLLLLQHLLVTLHILRPRAVLAEAIPDRFGRTEPLHVQIIALVTLRRVDQFIKAAQWQLPL